MDVQTLTKIERTSRSMSTMIDGCSDDVDDNESEYEYISDSDGEFS